MLEHSNDEQGDDRKEDSEVGSVQGLDEIQASLFTACHKGSYTDVEEALKKSASVHENDEFGYDALQLVTISRSHDTDALIDLVLKFGADVNSGTSPDQDTSLHLAIRHLPIDKVQDVVVKLLTCGADPDIRNKRLRSPFDEAIEKGYIGLTTVFEGSESLAKAKDEATRNRDHSLGERLIKAVISGTEEDIRTAIERGANVNYINEHGAGAIHYAITHCKLEQLKVVEILVEAGGDVNLRDHENDTAMNLAIKMEHLRPNSVMYSIVAYLSKSGTDKSIKDLDGKDAVKLACEKGYKDIEGLLVPQATPEPILSPIQESNEPESEPTPEPQPEPATPEPQPPDLNKPNEDGFCPIHLAVLNDESEDKCRDVEELINNGAQKDKKTIKEGNTALHLAVTKNDVELVKKLLQLDADCGIKNQNDQMAYDVAVDMGHEEIASILEEEMRRRNIRGKWKKAAKKAKFCVIL